MIRGAKLIFAFPILKLNMTKDQIQNTLLSVLNTSFPNNPIAITLNAKPQDIDAWDSLGHMLLINEVEKAFKIKFDLEDMLDFDSVSSILTAVYDKLG